MLPIRRRLRLGLGTRSRDRHRGDGLRGGLRLGLPGGLRRLGLRLGGRAALGGPLRREQVALGEDEVEDDARRVGEDHLLHPRRRLAQHDVCDRLVEALVECHVLDHDRLAVDPLRRGAGLEGHADLAVPAFGLALLDAIAGSGVELEDDARVGGVVPDAHLHDLGRLGGAGEEQGGEPGEPRLARSGIGHACEHLVQPLLSNEASATSLSGCPAHRLNERCRCGRKAPLDELFWGDRPDISSEDAAEHEASRSHDRCGDRTTTPESRRSDGCARREPRGREPQRTR